MSMIGDLARQDDYLPDVGPPLVPSGPPFSPGVPAVNQAMGSLLAPRPRDPNSPVAYRTASPLVNISEQDIADATEAAMASSGGGLGIKAYHSSPYDFDKFDLSKVGTGEGAQVYGHGIYAAENPAVSGQGGEYWKQFARRFQGDEHPPELVNAVQILESTGGDRAAALDKIKQALGNVSPTAYPRAHMERVRDLLASDKPVGPRTYEVDIKADPAQFLNWDKPLSAQSAAVQALDPRAVRPAIAASGPLRLTEPTGQDIYRRLTIPAGRNMSLGQGAARASDVLNEAGIPGIRYLDQGSRGKGTGSSNYVVFNPAIIDILRKYGIAGAAPLGIGALAAQDQYNPP